MSQATEEPAEVVAGVDGAFVVTEERLVVADCTLALVDAGGWSDSVSFSPLLRCRGAGGGGFSYKHSLRPDLMQLLHGDSRLHFIFRFLQRTHELRMDFC